LGKLARSAAPKMKVAKTISKKCLTNRAMHGNIAFPSGRGCVPCKLNNANEKSAPKKGFKREALEAILLRS